MFGAYGGAGPAGEDDNGGAEEAEEVADEDDDDDGLMDEAELEEAADRSGGAAARRSAGGGGGAGRARGRSGRDFDPASLPVELRKCREMLLRLLDAQEVRRGGGGGGLDGNGGGGIGGPGCCAGVRDGAAGGWADCQPRRAAVPRCSNALDSTHTRNFPHPPVALGLV